MPSNVHALATDALNELGNNLRKANVIKMRGGKARVIRLSYNYRILLAPNSKTWKLMSHERYNKLAR